MEKASTELWEMSLFMWEEEKEAAGQAGRALGQAGIQLKQGQRSRNFHTDRSRNIRITK